MTHAFAYSTALKNQETQLSSTSTSITKDEAEALCIRLNETMDALNNIIEAETRLVKVGKMREASHLQAEKAEHANNYVKDVFAMQAHANALGVLVPSMVERTRKRHDAFRNTLQANMAALDIARNVSEQLIKDVAKEVSTPQTLNTYGANGSGNAYKPNIASISVDKAL